VSGGPVRALAPATGLETEDAVQQAWLRLDRSDADAILDLRARLTTVVGRICLDMLLARKAHHVEYVGSWLPEPLLNGQDVLPAAGVGGQLGTAGAHAGHPPGTADHPAVGASWEAAPAVIPADPQGHYREDPDHRTASHQCDRGEDIGSGHVAHPLHLRQLR
jgi:hypothetical protein